MERYELMPDGWPCRLRECPPGPFIHQYEGEKLIGFKSEYYSNDSPDAYNQAGEFINNMDLVVWPARLVVTEVE